MSDTEVTQQPFVCDECGKVGKSLAGLQAHKRFKHPADGVKPSFPKKKVVAPEPEPVVVPEVIVADEPPTPTQYGQLQPYPWPEGGVNENAAIRVIRMVQPMCPVDPVPELLQRDGSYKPNPRFTGEQNCQQLYKKNGQGVWDVEKCISLGHDPWHTSIRKTIVDDVIDPVTGEVTKQRTRVFVEKRLNVIGVTDNPRHSTGTEVQLAIARGCRFLKEFGYEEPCQFRNCTRKQRVQTRFGNYCSERHARLVAADKQEIILPVASGDEVTADKMARERELALGQIAISEFG